jgi:hypothetical protein
MNSCFYNSTIVFKRSFQVNGVQQMYIEKCDEGDPELCIVEILEARGSDGSRDPMHVYDFL